jgi:RNA-directed DNA polymerase
MNDEVFEAQRELAKKAKEHGSGAKEVQNMQKLLAESLTFRIVTVANLLKNKGSGTAGVDNETLTKETTAEQKIELVEWLKKILRSQKPYKASPVRRVLIPKASFPPSGLSLPFQNEKEERRDRGGDGKMRPLGIPTIKDRALQSLLNLVLEPVVELVRRLTIFQLGLQWAQNSFL